MKRQSKLMIVPIVVVALLASCMLLDRSPKYLLFVGPWETLQTSICALLSMDTVHSIEFREVSGDVCKNILSIVGYVWLVILPLVVYIYKEAKLVKMYVLNDSVLFSVEAYYLAEDDFRFQMTNALKHLVAAKVMYKKLDE